MDNKTIKKTVKLSREYPKTTHNVKLLQIYLSKNGNTEKRQS